MRALSVESQAFVDAMLDEKQTDEERVKRSAPTLNPRHNPTPRTTETTQTKDHAQSHTTMCPENSETRHPLSYAP